MHEPNILCEGSWTTSGQLPPPGHLFSSKMCKAAAIDWQNLKRYWYSRCSCIRKDVSTRYSLCRKLDNTWTDPSTWSVDFQPFLAYDQPHQAEPGMVNLSRSISSASFIAKAQMNTILAGGWTTPGQLSPPGQFFFQGRHKATSVALPSTIGHLMQQIFCIDTGE